MCINNEKIYAVIVVYKPNLESLKKSIELLLNQINYIVIVNNSDVSLPYLGKSIKTIGLGMNYGIAYAQNIGMDWAYHNGADYVIQMDQDSIIHNDTVINIMKSYHELTLKGYKIGLVGCIDYDKDSKILNYGRIKNAKIIEANNYFSVNETMSSGSLIPRKVYYEVGQLMNLLFIDAVDSEYCWRMKRMGYKVIINSNALIAHKLGHGRINKGFIEFQKSAPIRHYYEYRNFVFLFWKKYVPINWKINKLIIFIAKILLYPLLLEDWKIRLKYICCGLIDGFSCKLGKFGKTIKCRKCSDCFKFKQ